MFSCTGQSSEIHSSLLNGDTKGEKSVIKDIYNRHTTLYELNYNAFMHYCTSSNRFEGNAQLIIK